MSRTRSKPRSVSARRQSFLPRIAAAVTAIALAAAMTQWSAAAETGRSDRVPSGWQRPNIVLVYCDDHAYQAISAYQSLSAYGLKLNQTPQIDRLAREGMRFDNCFVTNSICGPCRAVVQTGKYSHLNGFLCNGDRFDGRQQTFPKLLQKAGYQTAVVGKWHLESDPAGYDYWHVLIGQGPYYNPPMVDNGKRVKHIGYTTEIITDIALDWLKNRRDPNRPFMLMCQHKAPHREWEPGPGYLTMYDDVTIPEPDTLFDDYSGRGTAARTQDMSIAKTMTNRDLKLVPLGGLTPEQLEPWNRAYEPKNEAFRKANLQGRDLVRWKYQRYMKDYLRCIAAVDDNLGRLLKYLDDAGLAQNTVVIYSSDQGFYLGEHGWFDKRWIYQESLRTPLIVRWPGVVKPGSTNQDIVSNLDFAETFLELAGQQVPGDMQGRSLVPLLKGQTPADWRKAFYYHYYEYPAVHSVRRHYGVVCQWPGAGGQEVRMQNAERRMPKSEILNPKSQIPNLKSEIGNLKSEPPSPESPAPIPQSPAPGLYKLIHFYPSPWDPNPIDEWELYDLKSDPKELKSVYSDPRYAEVQKRLEGELARLRRELKVPAQDPPQTARGPLRKAKVSGLGAGGSGLGAGGEGRETKGDGRGTRDEGRVAQSSTINHQSSLLTPSPVPESRVPSPEPRKPNILFAIADDWGWPHAGVYGDAVVKTPTFDRLAREGVLFHHAYVSSPSCTPSRGAILTGQWHWRLEAGANLWSVFPDKFATYPELLKQAGYEVGVTGKGWGPGRTETPSRELAGKRYPSFQAFLQKRQKDKPFCFWLGSGDPHRPYQEGTGKASGMDLDRVHLFACLPDCPEVRSDVADYYFEVQRFDRLVGAALASLEAIGELDDTVVFMTGDNGMPFPRCKSNLYDSGTRMPLAVRWPGKVKPGRTVDDFVSFTDFAPTFLEIAGLKPPAEMTGRSLISVLMSEKSGRIDPARDFVLTGKERHCPAQERPDMGGYPCRAIRTHDFLYIRSFRPDRWPAGTPDYEKAAFPNAWYGDCDNGPTKSYMITNCDKDAAHRRLYDLAFAKRPAEELYDLRKDPDQLENVAADPGYTEIRGRLAKRLGDLLRASGDPRVIGGGEKFDKYPYLGGAPTYPGTKPKRQAGQRLRSVREKGDRSNSPERPEGCFAQIGPVLFFLPTPSPTKRESGASLSTLPEGLSLAPNRPFGLNLGVSLLQLLGQLPQTLRLFGREVLLLDRVGAEIVQFEAG